jgi:hypothetical protein
MFSAQAGERKLTVEAATFRIAFVAKGAIVVGPWITQAGKFLW